MAASHRIESIAVEQFPDRRPKRVCIVTSEFVGLWRNGGIGTAMSGLAELLARHGHQVTVLYTRGHFLTAAACRSWTSRLARHGIAFLPTRPRDFRGADGPLAELGFLVPAIVARLLRQRDFDVVHLCDAGGHGYLVAAAQHFGLGFADTRIVTGLHSPTRWTSLLNATPDTPLLRFVEEAEQVAIGCSEIVWSPSRYLIDWLVAHQFRLPPTVLLQQYVLPSGELGGPAAPLADTGAANPGGSCRTLVFFGRLETRKGLGLFLDVVDRSRDRIAAAGIDVVFMGRVGRLGGERADAAIRRRAADWQFPWRIISSFGQAEALAFLQAPGRLAVIASPQDNSPCTVYEAIERGIPFVAAATGGIPEIIHPEDAARVSFAYDAAALQDCLDRATRCGVGRPARPAITREENEARWLGFHAAPERWAAERMPDRNSGIGMIGVVIAAARLSQTRATVDGLLAIRPAPDALLVVGGAAGLPDGVLGIGPRDLGRVLSQTIARRRDAAVVFVEGGATCAPTPLMRMVGHLGIAGLDGLIPAACTSRGRTIDPPPFSARLRGVVDPLSAGLIAFSAASVVATLGAADQDRPQTPWQLIEAVAAADGVRLLPYPEVIATLPRRRALRRRRAHLEPVASRDRPEEWIRWLAMATLRSPAGSIVPYAVSIAEGVSQAVRRFKGLFTAGS